MVSSIPLNPLFAFVAGGSDYILIKTEFNSEGFSLHSSAAHYIFVSSFMIKIDEIETAFLGRVKESWDIEISSDFETNYGDFLAYASSWEHMDEPWPSPPFDYAVLYYIDLAKILEARKAKEGEPSPPDEEDEVVEFNLWAGYVSGDGPETTPMAVQIAVYEGGPLINELSLGELGPSVLRYNGELCQYKRSSWMIDIPLPAQGRVGDVSNTTWPLRKFPEQIAEGVPFATRGHYITHIRYNLTTKELSYFNDPS